MATVPYLNLYFFVVSNPFFLRFFVVIREECIYGITPPPIKKMLSLLKTSDISLLCLTPNSKSLIVILILLLVFAKFIDKLNNSDAKYSKIVAKKTGDELVIMILE